jgi:hypothetical protein
MHSNISTFSKKKRSTENECCQPREGSNWLNQRSKTPSINGLVDLVTIDQNESGMNSQLLDGSNTSKIYERSSAIMGGSVGRKLQTHLKHFESTSKLMTKFDKNSQHYRLSNNSTP